ncbi:MAG: imidazolonepropionase [bacterium]|jgi:imidazolonepropionase
MGSVLVRNARQLLTLRGPSGPRRGAALRDLAITQDGAVLVRDGIIIAVGPTRRIENLSDARHAREIDASGRVVGPGFVDSHTHLICGPPRLTDYEMRIAGANYDEIAAVGGGILWTVRAVRDMPIRKLEHQARHAIAGFLRHGVTTIEVKSGYGLDDATERKMLRVVQGLDAKPVRLVPTYLGAHVVPPEWEGRAGDYISWMCTSMLPSLRRRRLAEFVDVYCSPNAFSVEQARRYLLAAREQGYKLKIHAEQFEHNGSAQLAVELEAVSADHLDYVNEDDVRALARSQTIATLLPGSVLHLGLSRYAPARALIDAGAAVALATDFNPGTSPTYSMPMILSLACSQMRMTPAEAISAATINGAHAVGRAAYCGSIEAGKDADLVVYDVPDYREIPYHFGVNPVAITIRRGAVIYSAMGATWQED